MPWSLWDLTRSPFWLSPRVIAGILMFPIIYVAAAVSGIVGGVLAGLMTGSVTVHEFMEGARLYFFPVGCGLWRNQVLCFWICYHVDLLLSGIFCQRWCGRGGVRNHAGNGTQLYLCATVQFPIGSHPVMIEIQNLKKIVWQQPGMGRCRPDHP